VTPERESPATWLWQAAMAAIVVATLGGVKQQPQLVLAMVLVLHVAVQLAFASEAWARRVRTGLLLATTWLGMAVVGYALASAATPPQAHPDMPIGEALVGFVVATVAALVVLWLRWQRSDPWADDATARSFAEPRLARVVELLACAALVRVAIDWID